MKFARYLALRIAAMIVVLLVVTLVTHLIFEVVPSDPSQPL
jgi:ABC-type dipeptide/oligopeptide/nickel transport system permease component